jgi:hypothetical protein
MTDVIDFLEQMGQNARLRHADRAEIERALITSGLDPSLKDALVAGDAGPLNALLGANADMCCLIHAPDQDDEEDEHDRDDFEDDSGDA